MKPVVIRSTAAKRDLTAHFVWLAGEAGVEVALRFLDAAKRSFDQLAAMPMLGPVKLREGRFAGIRMWRVSGFENVLVFYRPVTGGVSIERVIDAKRDYHRVLG